MDTKPAAKPETNATRRAAFLANVKRLQEVPCTCTTDLTFLDGKGRVTCKVCGHFKKV